MMEKFNELHIEKDFWDDFIVEAFEHIDEIETNAMSLEQNPENMDIIHTMFRAFHTIKGLSGFVEHTIIQEVAHKTETMMDLCRKGELAVNTRIVDSILKSSDYIKRLCESMDAYSDEAFIGQIIELLEVLEEISVGTPADAPVGTVQQEAEVIEAVVEEIVEEVTPKAEDLMSDDFFEGINIDNTQEEINEEVTVSPELINEESVQEEIAIQEVASEIIPVEEPVSVSESEELPQENIEEEAIIETAVEEFKEVSAQIEESNPMPEVTEKPADSSAEVVFEFAEAKVEVKPEVKPKETVSEPVKELTPETVALTTFQKQIMAKLGGNAKSQSSESSSEGTPAKQTSSNEEYMKVANYKIDHLVDMISELIINQSLIEQYVNSTYSDDRQLVTNMSGFLRTTRELQNLSMSLRMVSLKSTFQKLTRIARDTIQELKKDVEIVMSGENTEIDRAVAEKLLDPLVHMIKNAISHGIEENPDDRIPKGKNRRARVELNAYNKRGKIFLEVKDDGKGINTEIVYAKALEKGLIDSSRTYTDAEIREFIMLPGFSTAKVVDNISGRGVGMDVVKTQILKTGGKVDIQSELDKGSTFTLEVPVNHAIMNGTIIQISDQQFVVPTVNVKEFLQPKNEQWIFTKNERTMIRVRDNIIPIVPVSTFIKGAADEEHVPLVMILELDQELRAVPIVNVINRQEVVVKPVSEEFSHLRYISGMSILGTGRVSLILDIDYLFRKEVTE